jgi:hypothetical protein
MMGNTPHCTSDVLDGLRRHAREGQGALRPAELARYLGLGSRNVAVALAWLADRPETGVIRQKANAEIWAKYWIATGSL